MKKEFTSSIRRRIQYRNILAVAIPLLTVGLTGCGGLNESVNSSEIVVSGDESKSESGEEEIVISLGDQISNGTVIFTFAYENGYFDKYLSDYNYKIVVGDFASGPAMNESFASDNLDFATMGTMPAISGIANDYGYKIIAKLSDTDKGSPLIASADSGIESITDLKGKKVGTYIGGNWHFITLKYLEQAGLSADNVEIINTAAESANSIRAGEIDACVIGSATSQQLIDDGDAVLIENVSGVNQPSLLVARTKFAESHPEIAEAVIKVAQDVYQYQSENKDKWLSYIESKTGTSTESMSKVWDETLRDDFTFNEVDYETFDEAIQFMKENDLLEDDTFTRDQLFDLTYASEIGIEK